MDIVINVEQKDGWDIARYIGPINEESEVHLGQLLPRVGQKVIINLKGVTNVNSCGVRGWVNWMREAGKNREIIFDECTPEIVTQINMIPSFRGKAKIKSVYAAYSCSSCDYKGTVLFESGKTLPKSSDAGVTDQKCPKCRSDMEMDEMEDEFFAFVDAA